jgi:hypothetical protein
VKIIQTNIESLVEKQKHYVDGSYEQFLAFGGPCIYFHAECLSEGSKDFLSPRHIEMLYATLTAWGMHRMGDSQRTKTKLTNWERFSRSIHRNRSAIDRHRDKSMLRMSLDQYVRSLHELKQLYFDLDLTMSDSTLVVNSKAMFHLWPDYIPPIDRQYTVRFLQKGPDQWMTPKKRFRTVTLPKGKEKQFTWFISTCTALKELLDQIECDIVDQERQMHNVAVPKIIDNAIVHYVRVKSGKLADMT